MKSATHNLWLIRHGARLDVADPSWLLTAERRHDTPLSPEGRVQAGEVGARLAREGIQHLFASPFLRALETAEPIGAALNLPVRVEHGLCEAFYPQWFPVWPTFLPREEMLGRFPGVDRGYTSAVTPQYPETKEELQARTARTVDALVDRFPGNLALVSHGGAITGLCTALVGRAGSSVHAACCCLIHLVRRDGQWTIERDGRDTSHLSKTESELRFS
ncbi:MAG: histidine phosphatase family protein [Planctomycetota bacterium]|nr:histidine phosphatase family protein [Planctomycetota bacterium]